MNAHTHAKRCVLTYRQDLELDWIDDYKGELVNIEAYFNIMKGMIDTYMDVIFSWKHLSAIVY